MFSAQRPLEARHRVLIIGCGQASPHTAKLHAGEEVYTVDVNDEMNPDLIGDVLSSKTIDYLQQNQFDLICIESVPALLCTENDSDRSRLISRLMSMLSTNGTFIILASGNMRSDFSLFNALATHVDAFTLYHAYHIRCGKFPNSTLIAHRGVEVLPVSNDYVTKALELKYYSSANIINVEKVVITRAQLQQKEVLNLQMTNLAVQSIFKLQTNHEVNGNHSQNTPSNSSPTGCAIQ